ncbi:MAG: amidohydrolase [Gemmatimonadota bacterium]
MSGTLRCGPALLALALLAAQACSQDRDPPADLILLGGRVITVDASDRIVEAVAVRGERIVAVGTNDEVAALAGPQTVRVELDGRAVTPGLLDAHAHFNGGAVDRMFVLDLSYPTVGSVEDIVAAVAAQAERLPSGTWIQGRGWDEGKLKELRLPTAADLDRAAPDHPVWITQTMGHYGTANHRALELAGVTAGSPDPPGGTIDRDVSGRPTGVLKESAQGLVRRLIPEFDAAQVRQGMAALADAFNAEGMTGLKDPGVSEDAWAAYRQVLEEGNLTVRVFGLWRAPGTIEETRALIERIGPSTRPYESRPDDHLISGGVKLYIDGSGGARTAWLYDDWNRESTEVDRGNRGYPTRDPELIRRQIRLFHDAGLHVSVHSIGDRGIDWTVDSYQQALDANPIAGLRHGIIHANIPTDHALDVMADLQSRFDAAYPEPSASFMWWIGDTYAGNFGPERSLRLNPFRTYLQRGIRWAGGSDYSVTPFPARYGIWASVAREPLLGVYGAHPYGTSESVDVLTALRSFTIWAARQMFMEDVIGSIEVGKYADLAVWDRDPLAVPTADLKDMTCHLTVFNGEVVYSHPEGPRTDLSGTEGGDGA